MKVCYSIADLQLDRGKTIGFVPTMGAFHEGHLELMRIAKQSCEIVVVSIFVNPTQFAAGEDFEKYPRNLELDQSLAKSAGVDYIFAPSAALMYPRAPSTIKIPEITELWEGHHRPGHFDGVATVVAKLFNIVRPDEAYFGWKDFQQCMVIRRLVEDFNFPIKLRLIDTFRETSGLAMSSRNRYLSQEDLAKAAQIFQELSWLKRQAQALNPSLDQDLETAQSRLATAGFYLDYLELVDRQTLKVSRDLSIALAWICAAKLGTTRLIDNIRWDPE